MWYLKDGVPRLSLEVAKATVEESHKLGLKVIAHVGSENEAREMIRINVDGIEHGFATTSDSVFNELKTKYFFYTYFKCL